MKNNRKERREKPFSQILRSKNYIAQIANLQIWLLAILIVSRMTVDVVTKEDLQTFRLQLLEDFRQILQQQLKSSSENAEGYKTVHVRKILGCSVNKLVTLRIAKKIRTKKIGGTIYYNKEDVHRLLNENF